MKKLTAVLATCVMALFGSAAAAELEDWFDGGIGANWPADATMYGGAWNDGAEMRAQMSGDMLQIKTDEDEPLVFAATYAKPLGDDAAAKSATVAFSCCFQPFSVSALPAVPADTKGAVILVTTDNDPDEAEGGTLYYAAYDARANANVWKDSGVAATTNELVSCTLKITRGNAGFLVVAYNIMGGDVSATIRQADTTVRDVAYTGLGRARSLESKYEPGAGKTLKLVEITGLVVTNATADGRQVATGYGSWPVPVGSSVVVYYAAAPGYEMTGGGIVSIGTVTEDTTVDEDTPGIPKVRALGKYLVGTTIYTDFATMNAALKDGDTVTVLLDDTLPAGATIKKSVTFRVGGYVLSTQSGQYLTIAANVVFTADGVENLRLAFYVRADRRLTLPSGTALEDYSPRPVGEDYARVAIGKREWMWLDGDWQKAGPVTTCYYYPGYPDWAALTLVGSFGALIDDDQVGVILNSVRADDSAQRYYWDAKTDTLIDGVYWFDGSWTCIDAEGERRTLGLPERYVEGDFYANSTAIVFRITYDKGDAPNMVHDNPTGYSIETSPFGLGEASAPGLAFLGWTDAYGEPVTEIDPIALGRETGWLYDLTLYASWGPETTAVPKLKAATIAPGTLAAHYDSDVMAQTTAMAFNADKAGRVHAPAGFTGNLDDYAAHFTASAKGSTVEVVLTEEAEEKLGEKVDGAVAAVAAELADPKVKMVSVVDVEPGFYYSVVGGASPNDLAKEGERALAQDAAVELAKPDLGKTGAAFYRIKVSTK